MKRALMAVSSAMNEQALTKAADDAGIHLVRRCVDGVDLMAAARVDPTVAVICSLGVPRLEGQHIRELISHGRQIIGLTHRDEHAGELRALGVQHWVSGQGRAETTMRLVAELLGTESHGGVWQVEPVPPQPTGVVIGVTGPHGAPGRTNLAIDLARQLPKDQVCVVDADVVAPALAFRLQVIDDVSGLMLALRHLDHGTLRSATVQSSSAKSPDGFAVLTGIPDREFRERVGDQQVDAVIEQARLAYPWIVVDCGPTTFRGDVNVVVLRPDPLSVLRTIEILADEEPSSVVAAVVGGRSDVGHVQAALRRQGREVPVVRCRARDVLSRIKGQLAA
jgi:MinD-like ATPase involved in chromosome partitioning or flagellar assembly